MALIADTVFDQALAYIASNGVEGEIQNASDSVLVNSITLDASNYGSVVNNSGSGAGRKIQCFVSDSSDMKSISVSAAGTATKAVIKDASGSILITADISGSVVLGTSDQVNIGTTSVILKDPS